MRIGPYRIIEHRFLAEGVVSSGTRRCGAGAEAARDELHRSGGHRSGRLAQGVEPGGEERGEAGAVVEAEAVLVLEVRVGDEGDRLARRAERLGVAGADAEELDAVRGGALVALGDDDVEAAVVAADDLGERQLAVQPGDEGEALRRRR